MKIIKDIQKNEETQPTTPPPPEDKSAVFFRSVIFQMKLLILDCGNTKFIFVFSRGEHLAVRNAEGSFYLCQAQQQIYKTSKKIRIQWMGVKSGDNPSKDLFIPEYYDKTGEYIALGCFIFCYRGLLGFAHL